MQDISEKYSVRILLISALFTGFGFVFSILLLFILGGSQHSFSFDAVVDAEDKALLIANHGSLAGKSVFQEIPSMNLWVLFIVIGFSFSMTMIHEVFLVFRRISRVFRFPVRKIVVIAASAVVLISVMTAVPSFINYFYSKPLDPPMNFFYCKMTVYFIVNGIASALCIAGIVVTGNVAFNLRKRSVDDKAIVYFSAIHRLQLRLVLLLGVQLTIAILAIAYMRQVHVEMYGIDEKLFVKESVAVYGIFYTCILAVFFIPARRELQAFGYRIIDYKLKFGPEEGQKWSEWKEERQSMIDLLKLQWNVKSILEWAVPVLAPLVSSVLPEFLHKLN